MSVVAMEHVLVLSDDIQRTRDFYCVVVGLMVGERPPLAFPGYWLYADAAGASCIHIAERQAYATHAAGLGLHVSALAVEGGSVDHVAFRAGSDDYDGLLERLSRAGIDAVTNDVPGGPRQVFIEDPNGVRVEINVMTTPEDEAR
jgi:catechol 2,3-dioxygenase-like lactoylglutathione lyase family enzyme